MFSITEERRDRLYFRKKTNYVQPIAQTEIIHTCILFYVRYTP